MAKINSLLEQRIELADFEMSYGQLPSSTLTKTSFQDDDESDGGRSSSSSSEADEPIDDDLSATDQL